MSQSMETILDAARKLPLNEQRQLAARIVAELPHAQATDADIEASLNIVRETCGVTKGLDRETIIRLAEDDEFCGY